MKKTTRQLLTAPVAASPAAQAMVARVRELDVDALRSVLGGDGRGAFDRQRTIIV